MENVTEAEPEFFEFPFEYIPCIISIIIVLIYSLAIRLAYTFDYKKMHQGQLFILEKQSVDTSLTKGHLYLIIIDTGLWQNAGTQAHVRLEIHAKNFCSRVYCLRPTNEEKILQRGGRDIFVLNTSDCLGDILSLTLLIITPGRKTAWFLEAIKVYDVIHNRKWLFPCYRWLSNNNRPTFVVKLFPHLFYIPTTKQFFQNRGMEINTWLSIFLSYNRLGRLNRMERISICANTLMSMIFAYVALVQSEYWYILDGDNSTEMFLFVLLCFTIIFLVILMNYLPEMILRNSYPIFFSHEDMTSKMGELQCVDCNRKAVATDSAVLFSEICPKYGGNDNCLNLFAQSKTYCKDNEGDGAAAENEAEFDEELCKFKKTPKELIGEMLSKERKKKFQIKDLNLITKYYDLAAKYIKFFDMWGAFCDKFCDIIDELKTYMDSYMECELMRRRKCLIWLLGGMEEIQEQFCIVRRNCINTNLTSQSALERKILFPDSSCCSDLDDPTKQAIRLLRLCVFLMLIVVIDWLETMKNIQLSNLHNIPGELRAQLHHLIFNLFYGMDAFILKHNFLYQVCNKVLCKEVDTVDAFISIYMDDPEKCDFELVECCNDDAEENVRNCLSWNPLHDIRTHISNHTNSVVSEVIEGVVRVCCCRQPISTFGDYMRYRSNLSENEPLEWASVCVDFTLPLVAALSKPLISKVQQFTELGFSGGFVCTQIQQYSQTVIINAALQLLREVKSGCRSGRKSRIHDPFQDLTTAEMCFPNSDGCDACSEYGIAVNRFRHCLQSNNIINQSPDKCCPEGKCHIYDPNILKLLLEEGKLKPNQLACGKMVESVENIVGTYHEKLVTIEKFVNHALLMLMDSQEVLLSSTDCASNTTLSSSFSIRPFENHEVMPKITQQIQHTTFILAKLIRLSKEKVQKPSIGEEVDRNGALFWTSKGYVDQPFIRAVESFKHDMVNTRHPFTNREVLKIQALAFDMQKLNLSSHWTLVAYIFIGLQSVVYLALIVYWAPRMSPISGLACIPVLIIGIIFEITIAQPLKLLTARFLVKRYKQISIKRKKEPEIPN